MGKSNLSYLETEALRELVGNRALSVAGVAIGTTKSELDLAATVDVCIDGQAYTITGGADSVSHTDTTVVPAGTTRWFLISVNAAGTTLITQGTATALPAVPDDNVVLGAIKIVATNAFTPGTTLHDAAGIATTYYNLSCLPLSGLPS